MGIVCAISNYFIVFVNCFKGFMKQILSTANWLLALVELLLINLFLVC